MDKGHCWLHKELKRFSPSVAQFLSLPLSVYLSFILAPYNVLPYISSPVRSGQWLSIHLDMLLPYSQHVVGVGLLGDILNCSGWLTRVCPSVTSGTLEEKAHPWGSWKVQGNQNNIFVCKSQPSFCRSVIPLLFGKLPAIPLLSSINTDSNFWALSAV